MKKYSFTKVMSIIVCCFIYEHLLGQNEKIITVEPAIDSFENHYLLPKPTFHKLKHPLTVDEIHTLETLSIQERSIINTTINPPVVGVIRNLNAPLIFSFKGITIPESGEITMKGGRLSRINSDTLVFTTCFRSPNASEMRIFFSKGYFPTGVYINTFGNGDNATRQELKGEIDSAGFFTPTVFSDYVILQVIIPAKAFSGNLHFTISKLTHIEEKDILQTRVAADCYVGANCAYANSSFSHIDELRKATVYLLIPDANSSSISQCSGGLLNDARSGDFQPFVLTANHCFVPSTGNPNFSPRYSAIEARFDYVFSSCNSGNLSFTTVIGANLIKRNSQSDFALLLLKEKPAGSRIYLGWTTSSPVNNEFLHSVNHPQYKPQQYTIQQNKTSPSNSCTSPISNFIYTRTAGGETNGGSSGGLIVNYAGHVVGQLFGACYDGGFDGCNYTTYNNVWGRFSTSYNNFDLQYWLNDGGAAVKMTTAPSATLNFGDIALGLSDEKAITVSNTGTVPNYLNLEVGMPTISGTSASEFSITNGSFLYLSPGRSDDFTIKFSPTSPGPKTATLNIPNNADNITGSKKISLTGCAAPSQPDSITGFILPSKDVKYTYTITKVPGATSYTWTYSGTGVIEQHGTSCTVTPETNGTLSVIANGICASSPARTLDLNVVSGIRVYPNPVSKELVIEYGGNQAITEFKIFSATGELVFSGNIIGRTVIQMDTYSSGIYLIKFATQKGVEFKTVKIVKH